MAMAHVSSSDHKGFSYVSRTSSVPDHFKFLMESNPSSECPVSWPMEHLIHPQPQPQQHPQQIGGSQVPGEIEWQQFVDSSFVCSSSLTIPVSLANNASANNSEVSNKNNPTNMSSYGPGSITSSPNPGGWTTSSAGLGLTVDPSKGGLALQGLGSGGFQAEFPDPGFAERAARLSASSSPFYGHQSPNKLSRTSSIVAAAAAEEALKSSSGLLDDSKLFSKLHKVMASQQQEVAASLKEDSLSSAQNSMEQGGIMTPSSSSRKRKSDKSNAKVSETEDSRTKRARGGSEASKDLKDDAPKNKGDKSSGSDNNSGSSSPKSTTVKESPKPPEAPKQDYIHVRARRGQATDSHSLAERVRREKISERMKFLQDLVPGCSKVTGKAVMLDEIINYVQSLQRQVEFLSMKLAAVNPRLDINLDGLLTKEVLQGRANASPVVLSHDLGSNYSTHLQQLQHAQMQLGTCGLDLRSLENIIRGDAFADSTSQASSVWDGELQSVVQMSFGALSQELQGHLPAGHMKVEI